MSVIDLTGGEAPAPPPEPDGPSGLRGLVLVAVSILAVVVGLSLASNPGPDGGDPDATEATPEASADETPDPTDVDDADPSADGGVGTLEAIDFQPVAGAEGVVLTIASQNDGWQFWRVDVGAGVATSLQLDPTVDWNTVAEVRVISADHIMAATDDATLLSLVADDTSVTVAAAAPIGDNVPLGLAAISPDGNSVWVGTRWAFLRWNLDTGQVDRRWLDMDGDREELPTVDHATADGLIVTEAGRSFLIAQDAPRVLDLDGEIIDGADDWVVTNVCTDDLFCTLVRLTNIANGETYQFDRANRYVDHCGLITGASDGGVHVVMQEFGSSTLHTIETAADSGDTAIAGSVDLQPSSVDLHPGSVGCVDIYADGALVVVLHDRGFTVAVNGTGDDTTEAPVEFRQLEALRPIVAGSG